MNPKAAFTFNPNASTFVPKTSNSPAEVANPPVQSQTSDQPKSPTPVQTPQPKPVKKMEEESWEEKEDKQEIKTTTSPRVYETKVLETKTEELKISDADVKKELARIAAEEGITEEELLKEDNEEKKAEIEIGDLEEDAREHVNLVFIGHVDAGKSTISGSLLYVCGMVDKRTIEKYEREAKDNNRESWFFAYIMDTNEEERQKGITVEVGRADFETKVKRYTILDAPGHKNYVPNMIGGASQADIGVLVISGKKGEFEAGFTKGGQTKEHAMLAKTLGIKVLVVVINKMDDPTVLWSKDRYDEVVGNLTPYLKQCGFNMKDVIYIPISGLKGANLNVAVSKETCPWHDGSTLLSVLDGLKPIERLNNGPLRIPIIDKYKDLGVTVALGKIESGQISKGDQMVFIPNRIPCEVTALFLNDTKRVRTARAGENIRVALRGISDDQIHRGYVLCDKSKPIPCQTKFEAQLAILDLLPHKSIFCAGYTSIIHIHTAVEECNITVLVAQIDKKTGKVSKNRPQFVKSGSVVNVMIECAQPIPLELFTDNPQLGRFTLRDEGKTIAVGKVIALAPKPKKHD